MKKRKFTNADLDKLEEDLINYARSISPREPDDLFTDLKEEESKVTAFQVNAYHNKPDMHKMHNCNMPEHALLSNLFLDSKQ